MTQVPKKGRARMNRADTILSLSLPTVLPPNCPQHAGCACPQWGATQNNDDINTITLYSKSNLSIQFHTDKNWGTLTLRNLVKIIHVSDRSRIQSSLFGPRDCILNLSVPSCPLYLLALTCTRVLVWTSHPQRGLHSYPNLSQELLLCVLQCSAMTFLIIVHVIWNCCVFSSWHSLGT